MDIQIVKGSWKGGGHPLTIRMPENNGKFDEKIKNKLVIFTSKNNKPTDIYYEGNYYGKKTLRKGDILIFQKNTSKNKFLSMLKPNTVYKFIKKMIL